MSASISRAFEYLDPEHPTVKAALAEIEQMRIDAARYRWLRDTMQSAKGGASVTVNEQLAYYEPVPPGEEVRLQWYPDTPIGSYIFEAATIDEAIDAAMNADYGR
jgi:hypothetical protein